MTPLQEAVLLREAASVKRWHTQRTLREQTLAHHSYGVAMLAWSLDPDCRKDVILACMKHDLPEFITGDMPAHTKRNHPAIAIMLEEAEKGCAPLYEDFHLTVHEERLVKFCDLLELVFFCNEERAMGNAYALGPMQKGLLWLWELLPSLQGCRAYTRARDVLVEFTADMRRINVEIPQHANERQ
jgi:5'-deoxynucleotidase YfbR-like HD superfamily hydrolase